MIQEKVYKESMAQEIKEMNLELTNDTKIISCALYFDKIYHPDETIFVTNDIAQKALASLFFGQDCLTSVQEEEETYSGYSDVTLDEEEMGDFYQNLHSNIGNNMINSYLIVRDAAGQVVDRLRWTGEKYVPIIYGNFRSKYFGEVKPVKDDVYQAFAADSLIKNTITIFNRKDIYALKLKIDVDINSLIGEQYEKYRQNCSRIKKR